MVASPQIIPLQAVPSQTLRVTLGAQVCVIRLQAKTIQVPVRPSNSPLITPPVYEVAQPLYLDLTVNGTLVLAGVLCLTGVLLVRDPYLGFIGDLSFADTTASDDPRVLGLGTRWVLCYWPDLP